LSELEPNWSLDRKDDVVPEGPDNDEYDQGCVGRSEVTEAESPEGREQHRRRGHLCFAKDGQHRPGDKHDQKTGELPRELEPTARFGAEVMDLGKVIIEGSGEDA
jgi:hypothetical protein